MTLQFFQKQNTSQKEKLIKPKKRYIGSKDLKSVPAAQDSEVAKKVIQIKVCLSTSPCRHSNLLMSLI